MLNRLFIILIGIAFFGCTNFTDKLNGEWISGDLLNRREKLFISDGLWTTWQNGSSFRYKSELKDNKLTLSPLNPIFDDYSDINFWLHQKGDTIILTHEKNGDFVYYKKSDLRTIDYLISESGRNIELPKVLSYESDYLKSEIDIFIDVECESELKFHLNGSKKDISELFSLIQNQKEDKSFFSSSLRTNLYIDKNVSYNYVQLVEEQLRVASNNTVNYVISNSEDMLQIDSTYYHLNYITLRLPPFYGFVNDKINPPMPPFPGAPTQTELYNIHYVTFNNNNVVYDDVIMKDIEFWEEFADLLNDSDYMLIYNFHEKSTYEDYIQFQGLLKREITLARSEFYKDNYKKSYKELLKNQYLDNERNILKSIKSKIPFRLLKKSDFNMIKEIEKKEL